MAPFSELGAGQRRFIEDLLITVKCFILISMGPLPWVAMAGVQTYAVVIFGV